MESRPSSSNLRIARNSIFLTIRMFIVLIITLFTTRILLKSLGVVDYGVYNVVCGFVSMFAFLNTSMTNGIQRFFNFSLGNDSDFNSTGVFVTALKIQALLSIIIIVLTESVGLWYLHSKMVIPPDRYLAAQWIFQFSVISFLFVIMQAPFSAAIMAHEHMDYFAIVSVIDAALKLLIAISLTIVVFDRLIVYGLLMLGINVVNFFLYLIYARRKFPEVHLSNIRNKKLFSSMLSFSGWNIFGSFSGMMKDQGINLVLNYFTGPIVNAAKGVAGQVNGALQGVVANLTVAIRPQVIQSYASGDVNRAMRLTYSISKLSCCVLYLVSLPVVLEIHYILNIWLDGVVPEHTSTFVVLIVMITFINLLNSAVSGVIHASGKMMKYQVISSTISIMCVPAAYISMKYGADPESAFVWTLVFATISHIASLIILKGIVQYSIREYAKRIVQPFILLVVITFAFPLMLHLFMKEGLLRFAVVLFVSVVTGSLVLYFLTLDKDERTMINTLFASLKQTITKDS